jgi:HEAT repeat protein
LWNGIYEIIPGKNFQEEKNLMTSRYLLRFLFLKPLLSSSLLSILLASILSHSAQAERSLIPANINSMAPGCTAGDVEQYISAFSDRWQQKRAISQLVQNCGQTAIPPLAKVMQTEFDAGVRQAAAAALGYIGGADATKVLSSTLRNDSTARVRQTAADALGTVGDPSTTPLLIATLGKSNEDMGVRQSVATSLGDIGGPIVIDTLITMLQNTNESLKLRQSAVKALQTIKDPAIDSLVTVLGSKDLQTQYWAVTALSEISSERSIDTLETNKARVTEILEAAYKANIVEFDRAPVVSTRKAIGTQLPRKPLICKISWILLKWSKCQ